MEEKTRYADGAGKRTRITLSPSTITSHEQFDSVVLSARYRLTEIPENSDKQEFLSSMYYILGWCVGDFAKDYGRETALSARISLELTKKHPENLALGEHIVGQIKRLGVPCKRYDDRPPTRRSPNGMFFWKSAYSPIVGWLHKVALGLLWDERTTLNPVRMDWILTAPRSFRIWFLRGIADSDGNVNIRNRVVEITTSPNTSFFHHLFLSLGVDSSVRYSRGYGYVSIKASDAGSIAIFNPHVVTHRGKMLKKLVSSRAFQRRWPDWLESEVQNMISRGLGATEIRNYLLDQRQVYTKIKTIRRKISQVRRNE